MTVCVYVTKMYLKGSDAPWRTLLAVAAACEQVDEQDSQRQDQPRARDRPDDAQTLQASEQ